MLATRLVRALLIVAACSATGCARQHGRHRTRQPDASTPQRDASDSLQDPILEDFDAGKADADGEASEVEAAIDAAFIAIDASTDADSDSDAKPDASAEPHLAFTLDLRYPQVYELFALRADKPTEIARLSPDPRSSELVVRSLRYVLDGEVLLATISRELGEPMLYALRRGAAPQRLGARADHVIIAKNGTTIAVAEDRDAPFLYRIGPTGAELVVLDEPLPARDNSDESTLKLAPDGAHLLYQASSNKLAVVTLAGQRAGHVEYVQKAPSEPYNGPYDGVWASDGKHFAYRSWGAQLYVANPDAPNEAVTLGPPDLDVCAQLQAVESLSAQHAYVWCRGLKGYPNAGATVFVFDLAGQLLAREDDVRGFSEYCGDRALLAHAADKAVLLDAQDGKLVRVELTLAGPALRAATPVFSPDCTQAAYSVDSAVVQLDLVQSAATGTQVQQQTMVTSARGAGSLSFSPRGRYLSVRFPAPLLLDVKDGLRTISGYSGDSFFGPDDAALFHVIQDLATSTTQLERLELPDTSRTQTLLAGVAGPFALDDEARFLAYSASPQHTSPAAPLGGLYEIDLHQGAAATPVQRLYPPAAPAGGVYNVRFIAREKAVVFEADLEESGVSRLYARTLESGATTLRQDVASANTRRGSWLPSADGTAFAAMTLDQGMQRGWVAPFQLRAHDPKPIPYIFDVPRFSAWFGFGPERNSVAYRTYDVRLLSVGVHEYTDTGFTRVDLHTLETRTQKIEPATQHFDNLYMGPRTGSIFYSVVTRNPRTVALYVLDGSSSTTQQIANGVSQYRLAPSEDWLAVEFSADRDRTFGVARRTDGWRLTLVDKPADTSINIWDILEHDGKEYVVFSDGSSYPAGLSIPVAQWPSHALLTPDKRGAVQLTDGADATLVMRRSPLHTAPVRVVSLPGSSSNWALASLSPRARYIVVNHYEGAATGTTMESYLIDLDDAATPPFRLPRSYRFAFDRSERYLAFEDESRNSLPSILNLADRAITPVAVPPTYAAEMQQLDWVE